MNYILKMMSKDVYSLSEEQAKFLLKNSGKQKLVAIPGTTMIINLACVESIIPEDRVDQSNQKEKYLEDGRRIVKKFGYWYLADDPSICIDENYFSELRENDNTKRLKGGNGGFKKIENPIKQLK